MFLSSTVRFHLNFQTRKINTRSQREKKTKEDGRQIFGSGSVGVGLGTLRDHVTFVTVEQKIGGRIEGRPETLEHFAILETTSLYRM